MTIDALTTSNVDDEVATTETRGLHTNDWLKPELETSSADTRTRVDASSTRTDAPKAKDYSQPVRRNSLSIRLPEQRVKMLQQWECIVQKVDADCVSCCMFDLTNEANAMELAEVYLDEFNEYDRPLLEEGAVFYWSIGRETSKSGQVKRYAELRVRRMPPLTKSRRREITRKAQQLGQLLDNSSK